jgi:hypothetical protein
MHALALQSEQALFICFEVLHTGLTEPAPAQPCPQSNTLHTSFPSFDLQAITEYANTHVVIRSNLNLIVLPCNQFFN